MFSNLKPVFDKAGPAMETIFSSTGLNAYFNYTFVRDPIREGINTTSTFLDDIETYSPNMYSNLGSGIGMTATSLGTSLIMGHGIYSGLRNQRIQKGAIEAYKGSSGVFSTEGGIMTSYKKGWGGYIKSGVANTGEEYITKEIAKTGAKKGWLNLGKGTFKRPSMGIGANLAITAGIIGAGIVGTMALSSVGSWVDQSSKWDIDRRRQHYDTREFYGVNRYLQSMNDTYNQSMDVMDRKLFSCARAYHSRG
jgi:F0F1-type ATP synthase membrane subunit c/vacuolar-type H+-ATPase subunit K